MLIDKKDGQQVIDFREPSWGNAYHSYGMIHSQHNPKIDDYFVLKQRIDGEIGDMVYKIVDIESMGNPKDMYQITKYISIGLSDDKEDYKLYNLNTIDVSDSIVFNTEEK